MTPVMNPNDGPDWKFAAVGVAAFNTLKTSTPISSCRPLPSARSLLARRLRIFCADNFSFPVLMVQSAANGFMSAGVVREASGELAMSADAVEYCEPITETLAPPGLFFPIRTLYIELATLRITQHVFTEQLWRKACRQKGGTYAKTETD